MLFQTTPAHEELRAKIRAFAEEEIKPLAFLLDQNNEFPDEPVKKMAQLGWLGLPFPKEYGGAGLDILSYAIAVEELARVDGGAGVILSAHVSLGAWPIFAYGTEEQKRKYLVPLAKGEKLGAFGLTEPNAGSDAGGTETTALDKGDHYLLNGGKIFITNAPKADTYVVFAVTTPDIGTRGISAFIVEKGWKGFDFGDHYDKMGIRSSSTAELIFNDVKVPKENLLGKEGDGFKIAMSTLDGGRIGIAAQALGIAQGAFEHALAYAGARPVRQAHRGTAGRFLQAGGHGHQAALRPIPRLLRGGVEGATRPLRHGVRHGEDVRLGHRAGGHQRRHADPRRHRLPQGHGGGARLPRRQDHHHL